MYVKKCYIQNPSACSYENGKQLETIMEDSAITWGESIESYDEETKNGPTINEKNDSSL